MICPFYSFGCQSCMFDLHVHHEGKNLSDNDKFTVPNRGILCISKAIYHNKPNM